MTRQDYTGILSALAVIASIGAVAAPSFAAPSIDPTKVDPSILPAPVKAKSATKFGGPGSMTGIWQVVNAPNGTVRDDMLITRAPRAAGGAPIPMLPAVAAIVQQRIKDSNDGHPFISPKTRCLPQGVPDFGAGPFQILENGKQITILRQEFGFFRIIVVDGVHPNDPDPKYLGDSVAHWDGPDLVIDTIGLTDKTVLSGIIPHSEDLHVVERYHQTGKDTMDMEATINDPKTFSAPYKVIQHVHRITGKLEEYICENNRNAPDYSQGSIAPPR